MNEREIPRGWTLACVVEFKDPSTLALKNGMMGYGWDKGTCAANALEFARQFEEDPEVESVIASWSHSTHK